MKSPLCGLGVSVVILSTIVGSSTIVDKDGGSHLPTIEVHISNIYKREEFRQTSLTAPACIAVITGLGLEGYHAALRFLLKN